jgi:hypothetical protein
MKKQAGQRNFNMTDADLYVQCMERIRLAHRDIALFEQYGYEIDRLKGFSNRCEKYQNQPDDHEHTGDQMIATEKKDVAAEKLRTAIRGVMTRVSMKFHDKTGRYRKFGTAKLGDMTDPTLLFCGRRVVRVARQSLDFLSETGLNETHLKRISDACADHELAMNIQQDRIHERDIAVETRMELGNLIYEELVKLSEIGKNIWEEKGDLAKHEQYCIYESNAPYKKALKTDGAEKPKSAQLRR